MKTKFGRLLKLVLVNIVIFMVLLYVLNWGAGALLRTGNKGRETLPNYAENPSRAREIFYDYGRVAHAYEPFTGWRMLPYSGKTLHINEHGWRVHELPAYQADKDTSVWFFGGSTMWGEGADDDHTIPALYNRKYPQFDVKNFGQLAYNSRQELDALISLYSEGQHADKVIFYDGVNDAAFLCPSEITKLPGHRLVPFFQRKIYGGKSAQIREFLFNAFLDNIIRLIRSKQEADNTALYDCLSTPGKAEEIASIMVHNWEMAHQLVTANGGEFVAILQPAAFIGSPKVDHLKFDDVFRENFVAVYDHIRKILSEKNYPWVIDMTKAFDRDEYIYIDFCHVSPNGNALIVDAL